MLNQITTFGIISFINFVSTAILGSLAFFRGRKSDVKIAYAIFAYTLAFYAFFYFLWQSSKDLTWAITFFKWTIVGVVLINTAFFNFTYTLLNMHRNYKWHLYLVHVINLFFCYSALYLFYLDWQEKYTYGLWPVPSVVFHIYIVWWFAQVIFCFYLIWKKGIVTVGKQKQQCKWILAACFIGYIGGATNWFVWYGIKFPPYMNAGVALYALILGYAVLRHQLLDIEVVIKKTLVFTALFAIVSGFLAFILILGTDFLQQKFGGSIRWWLIIAASAIIVLAVRKLDTLLVNVTDRFLFLKKLDYRKILKAASEGLSRVDSLKHQLKLVTHFITSRARIKSAAIYMPEDGEHDFVLKASHCFEGAMAFLPKIDFDSPILMYLKNEKEKPYLEHYEIEEEARRSKTYRHTIAGIKEGMQKLGAHLIIPSFYQDELQGVLVLGEKRSEEPYNEEDINLFQTIAQESAIAFENARKHDELVENNKKLEEMMGELQKSQEQVIITKQEAAVSQLSGGIAHEVKNSIVGLIGGLDETQNAFETITRALNAWYRSDRPVPYAEKQDLFFSLKNALESLEYARTESLHIDDIVHTLSQLSKGQHAQMTRILLSTFLNRVINMSMMRTYGDQVRTQALEDPPELEVDDKVPPIRGHTELLKAVFINLVKNAIFAMDHVDKKKITIRVAQDSGQMVRIEFSDNGCGIPPEALPKIFDYGFTTKGAEGEGKGLHNVKMIIEKEHKGSIEVQSEVGKGTTFIIKLPVWKDRPDE